MLKLSYRLLAILLFAALSLQAQIDPDAVQEFDVYEKETAEKKLIDAAELPWEVRNSFKSSHYKEMEIIDAYRVYAIPMDSATLAAEKNEDDAVKFDNDTLTYREKEDKYDIAETYYQDTYDNTENLGDSLANESQAPTGKAVYFELEVSGETTNYRLFFDRYGKLRHAETTDI